MKEFKNDTSKSFQELMINPSIEAQSKYICFFYMHRQILITE